MYDSGDYSISDLADIFGVSRATIYRPRAAGTIMSAEVNAEGRAVPASDERPYSRSNIHRRSGKIEHACRYC